MHSSDQSNGASVFWNMFFFVEAHFLSLSHGNSRGGDGLFGIAGCCLLSAESKCHLFFPFLLLRALQGVLPVGCRVGNKTEKKMLRTKNTSSRKQRWGKLSAFKAVLPKEQRQRELHQSAAQDTAGLRLSSRTAHGLGSVGKHVGWDGMGWRHNHPALHPGSCAPSSPAAIPVLPGTALPSCCWI